MSYYVMGTGSRSLVIAEDRWDVYYLVEYKVQLLREKHADLVLISGLAEGFDEMIAKIGIRNGIPVVGYMPHSEYGSYYWSRNSLCRRDRAADFEWILAHLEDLVVCCSSIYVNGEHSNFIRNKMMVDAADAALVYNPASAGTRHAVRYLDATNTPYEVYPFEF